MSSQSQQEGLQEPLLVPSSHDAATQRAKDASHEDDIGGFSIGEAFKVLRAMATMVLPLLLNMTANYGVNIVTLSFVGHVGKTELAAAALGISLVGIVGRTVLYGMSGGLDTLASQAFGARNLDALGWHWRVCVTFLLLHSLPLCGLLLAAPSLLRREDAALGAMAGSYVLHMLPCIFLDCINRSINSVLVAQRITAPQMGVQLSALALHVANNYLFIFHLGLGYVGAAVAYCVTLAAITLMLSGYVWAAGLSYRVFGGKAQHESLWQGLVAFSRLSYPACFMRCAESWGFSIMTLAAGRLPDPGTSVAAISVAFNLYGILYMAFAAFSVTTSTQVGNALGAGSARRARHSALTALCTAPVLWALVAAALLEPHSQHALALIFTDGKDPELMYHLRRMLVLVAALELFDGSQVIMSGVIQGAGKQRLGVLVNIVAFYVFAIPVALLLGFRLGYGVEGMYGGMLLGPAIQSCSYASIIARLDWRKEAAKVAARAGGAGAAVRVGAGVPVEVQGSRQPGEQEA